MFLLLTEFWRLSRLYRQFFFCFFFAKLLRRPIGSIYSDSDHPPRLNLLPSFVPPATNPTVTHTTTTTATITTTAAEPGCRLLPAVTRRDWKRSWKLDWRHLLATAPTRKGETVERNGDEVEWRGTTARSF